MAAASSDEKTRLVQSAITGASYLVGMNTIQRVLTFGLNQLLLRHIDPRVFGTAEAKLYFLLTTVLFLSREGFRVALVRESGAGAGADDETTGARSV